MALGPGGHEPRHLVEAGLEDDVGGHRVGPDAGDLVVDHAGEGEQPVLHVAYGPEAVRSSAESNEKLRSGVARDERVEQTR